MIYILVFVLAIFIFFIVFFRLYLYAFPKHKLVILMYHSILPTSNNELTVSVENLEKQFEYLVKKNYKSLFFSNLNSKLVPKSIIITFDDGYKNNYEYLVPLLKKFELKATIFLPTSKINQDSDKMTFEELRSLDDNLIEFALHSHNHINFNELKNIEIEEDLKKNIEVLERENIKFTKILAYPYGKFPKNNPEFFKILEKLDIQYALRIGNKPNFFPTKKPYELCRIGIDGSDSLTKFKWKLILGKIKL